MEIARRLIGASAVFSTDRKVIDVDIAGLVRRLLLFDKFILVSVRLQEFPLLVKYLGYEGLRDLLASKLIEIRCECLQLAQIGQSGLLGDPVLKPFLYKFNWVDAHDHRAYVHDCLQGLNGAPGLQRKQILKLKRSVASAIRRIPEDFRSQVFPSFQNELLHNNRLIATATAMVLRERLGVDDVPFSIRLHQESDDVFRAETDIGRCTRLSEPEAHKIVEKGLMGIGGLSQSIGEMKHYAAISGFRDEELPLFRHKLDFLADAASSQVREHNFRRVIDVSGIPDLSTGRGTVSVDRLLKIRDSSETREFRDWLGGIGAASDSEIRDRVASFRAKAGLKVASGTGRAMRFLVTNGLGLIPHTAAPAVALGALDQFVLDKLLPRSGIAAFVNELYPSIFRSTEK